MRRASIALLLTLGCTSCGHWLYPMEVRATEVLYATTEDGWRLALHHFAPPEGLPKRHHPVIVCHGISSNIANWDLTERLSFPLYLARLGFDVYAVELRGSGASDEPSVFNDLSWDYSADDYIDKDLPALIDFVRERTGVEQVHWVGHSMGGMVLYGYLERVGEAAIRSGTTVGSPAYVLDHNDNINRMTWLVPLLDFFFDGVPSGFLTNLIAPLAGWPLVDEQHLIWNYDNMTPRSARLAAAHAVSNSSVNIWVQFAGGVDTGSLRSMDGSYDYSANLGEISAPILFAAGALDQLVPPALVMQAYREVASPDKQLVVFSRANGHAHDYGHVDMALGESAPLDVFPVLADWIIDHD